MKCLSILWLVTVAFTVTPAFAESSQSADALTDQQRNAIKLAQSEAEQKAAPIALRLAGVVKGIYENSLAEAPDAASRISLDAEMKELVWQLLMIKGESMWAAVRTLTPEQRHRLRQEVARPITGTDLPDLMDLIARTFSQIEKKH